MNTLLAYTAIMASMTHSVEPYYLKPVGSYNARMPTPGKRQKAAKKVKRKGGK